MVSSMRRLLAEVPELEVELSMATTGFFFCQETFFIVPLERSVAGFRIGDGEMLG